MLNVTEECQVAAVKRVIWVEAVVHRCRVSVTSVRLV